MQLEISIALNFLTQFLYDNLPRRRVMMFSERMFEYLSIKYQENWYSESPKDSEYRSISISYEKIDSIVIQSAMDIGLDLQEILNNLPDELTIWVDPGEVSYRIGEEGFAEILYKNPNENDENYPYQCDSIFTPILSAETFAQTKFGSLKTKSLTQKNSSNSRVFSAYIKQKEQLKLI